MPKLAILSLVWEPCIKESYLVEERPKPEHIVAVVGL
jgi:hypothetical protein